MENLIKTVTEIKKYVTYFDLEINKGHLFVNTGESLPVMEYFSRLEVLGKQLVLQWTDLRHDVASRRKCYNMIDTNINCLKELFKSDIYPVERDFLIIRKNNRKFLQGKLSKGDKSLIEKFVHHQWFFVNTMSEFVEKNKYNDSPFWFIGDAQQIIEIAVMFYISLKFPYNIDLKLIEYVELFLEEFHFETTSNVKNLIDALLDRNEPTIFTDKLKANFINNKDNLREMNKCNPHNKKKS